MARKPRAAARQAAANLRTPTPLVPDISDEEMVEAPASDNPTPRENNVDEAANEDGDAAEVENGDATPARDSEPPSRSNTPRGARGSNLPRKRRLGRPPRPRPPPADGDNADDTQDVPSDTGTPRRGRGGRGRGGGRWGKAKWGPIHTTQVPIDKEGNMLDVVNDEVALPDDPEGETKVDKLGNLLGGREYRVRIFTVLGRGNRQYMLSTEPARCIGFRDSYLFFQKHKLLYKIIIDEEEKKDLIERDLIPHSYKGRAIGVVTARSVFREFGAKIVIGGRKVLDDYNVREARERGDVEGELSVPEDRLPLPGEPYNRNQYVAWHGASQVYHSQGTSLPLPPGKVMEGKKRKITVTSDNWMLEHAREASRFNSTLTAAREETLSGVYDIHTNTLQYPRIMQPTHSRWEPVSNDDDDDDLENTGEETALTIQLASTHLESARSTTPLKLQTPVPQTSTSITPKPPPPSSTTPPAPPLATINPTNNPTTKPAPSTTFPPIPPKYKSTFRIHDTHLSTAPNSHLPPPGIPFYSSGASAPSFGLVSFPTTDFDPSPLSSLPNDILEELPPECREALERARREEAEWRGGWSVEGLDGWRGRVRGSNLWLH